MFKFTSQTGRSKILFQKLKSTDLFAELSGALCSQPPFSPCLQHERPRRPATAWLPSTLGLESLKRSWVKWTHPEALSLAWFNVSFGAKSIILSFHLHSSSICAWLKNLLNVKKDHWKETNIAQNKIYFTVIHRHFFSSYCIMTEI